MKIAELKDRVHGPQAEIDYLKLVVEYILDIGDSLNPPRIDLVGSRIRGHYISHKGFTGSPRLPVIAPRTQLQTIFEFLDGCSHRLNITTNQAGLLVPQVRQYFPDAVLGVNEAIRIGLLVADYDLLVSETPSNWDSLRSEGSLGEGQLGKSNGYYFQDTRKDVGTGAWVDLFFPDTHQIPQIKHKLRI